MMSKIEYRDFFIMLNEGYNLPSDVDYCDGGMAENITENLSYNDLFTNSDPNREKRADNVKGPPLKVRVTDDGNEAWIFNFKSAENTENKRHKGYIKFFKPNVADEKPEDLDCVVDCDCRDFKYRWAYRNTEKNASVTGANSYNKNNGAKPKPYNDLGIGLCKHLLALRSFLGMMIHNLRAKRQQQKKPSNLFEEMNSVVDLIKRYKNKKNEEFSQPNGPYTRSPLSVPDEKEDLLTENSLGDYAPFESNNNDWFIYRNPKSEVISAYLTEDPEIKRVWFEINYRGVRKNDGNNDANMERWHKRAASRFSSIAKKIHNNPSLSEHGNKIEKTWRECFEMALKSPEMEQYIKKVGYEKKNMNKLPPGYKVSISPEQSGWVGKVWINGRYIWSNPAISNTRDEARNRANKYAWDDYELNGPGKEIKETSKKTGYEKSGDIAPIMDPINFTPRL